MAATVFQRQHMWREPEALTPALMLFDIEVEDIATAERSRRVADEQKLSATVSRIASFSGSRSAFACQLLSDVRRFKWACVEEDGAHDNAVIATKLANIGYTVSLRTAIGGGQGTDCFHHLHHETLRVAGEGDQAGVDFIVDAMFRDQFTISHPTASYHRLLEALPQEFVGTSSLLAPLVQLMCQEMAVTFHIQGAMPPPWRHAKAMLSKWLPSKSRDLLLAANIPASPTASDAASSYKDSASYLFDSSSPISTLAPWKSMASPRSSLPTCSSSQPHERLRSPRVSMDSFPLKSALSSDIAASNSAQGRKLAPVKSGKAAPRDDLSKLPGIERIFTVKMRGF